mmetsp:Transcript_16896/g.14780  ORF Transcript_16896/g.14780 Transcript_16896/m.14780 type:complete len:225 (-) Transcript_16896:329-1003(-)
MIGVPSLLSLLPSYFFIYETPRYLASKKKYSEARDIINKMCKVNKRPRFLPKLTGELEEENNKATLIFPPKTEGENQGDEHTTGYLDLFRGELRKESFSLLYIWFFRNIAYFGLNFSLPVLGSEVYTNFTLAAVSEVVANLLAAPIKSHMSRVKSLNLTCILVTISCLMMVFFPIPDECYLEENSCYQKTFSVFFAITAKFAIALFANILITYTSEVYPTEVRA